MKRDVFEIMGAYMNDNAAKIEGLLDTASDYQVEAEREVEYLKACLSHEGEYTAEQIDRLKKILNLTDGEASHLFFDDQEVIEPRASLIDDQERPYIREAFAVFNSLCSAKECTALKLIIANALAFTERNLNELRRVFEWVPVEAPTSNIIASERRQEGRNSMSFGSIAASISKLISMSPEAYECCRMELQKEAETRGEAFLRFVDTLFSVADDVRNHA